MITVIQNQISCELNKQDVGQLGQVIKVDDFSTSSSNVDESMSKEIDSSDEIAVLLSGGVDSSVALKLLQLQVLNTAPNMIA
jgi:asparagine synthetase B (glutamine-hydrolysing)